MLEGRAIRVGSFWTVVQSTDRTRITVWGVVPYESGAADVPIEIAPSYRLRPGSPCLKTGENGADIGATQ